MTDFVALLGNYALQIAATLTVVGSLGTILSKAIEDLLGSYRVLQRKNSVLEKANRQLGTGGGSDESGKAADDSSQSSHNLARGHVVIRLNDARTARSKAVTAARVSRLFSGALTFAQVVIGGVLATSFVKESLPPKTVGIFGVLVLIASLVKQQYRPDVDAEQARKKDSKLRVLIRLSEDQLATIDTRSTKGEDRTDALLQLRDQISQGMTEIENSETVTPKKQSPKSLPQTTPEPTQ